MSAPIVTQFEITLKTIVETDASNQAIASMLTQYHIVDRLKRLHRVEYHAKTIMAT